MDPNPPLVVPVWLLSLLAAGCWASLAVGLWMLSRWRQPRPVLPYQPRRPVPWGGAHLALVLMVYLASQMAVLLAGKAWLEPELTRAPRDFKTGEGTTAHVISQVVAQSGPAVLLLCVLAAVVVAPVVEEFFFRVLLQGWLETLQRRWRRRLPTLRRVFPGGSGPILLSSFLFARMHFRVESPPMTVRFLTFLLVGNAVASLVTMAVAVLLLRARVGATAADMGWAPRKLPGDLGLGVVAFLAVAGPVYLLQLFFGWLLPKYLAPDPFALFFLALALGTLYWRTHRLVPSVAVHMLLNGASLAMAWLLR